MIRVYTICLLLIAFVFPLFADNDDYLLSVRYEPEYLNIQKDGKVKVTFNLPQLSLVKEAYIAVRKDALLYYIMPVTRKNASDLKTLNNIMEFSGDDMISASESAPLVFYSEPIAAGSDDDTVSDDDTEIPDEDNDVFLVDDNDSETPDVDTVFTLDDGIYACKLVLIMDTSGNGTTPTEEEEDDSIYLETDDEDDTIPTDVPERVTHTFNVIIDSIAPAAVEEVVAEGEDGRILLEITSSEKNIEGAIDEKIGVYHVTQEGLFLKDGVESNEILTYLFTTTEAEQTGTYSVSLRGTDGFSLINNDDDDARYRYTITVFPEDLAGNSDPANYKTVVASAITTNGFWNNYKESGGADDGEHCFIATASMGSYFHPRVVILRQFRDVVLAKTAVGQSFIQLYYKHSPPIARFIKSSPWLQSLTRFVLLPLIGIATILTHKLSLLLLLLLLFIVVIRRISLRKKAVVISLFLLFSVLNPSPLSAGVHGEVLFNSSLFLPEKIDDSATGSPFADIAGGSPRYMGGFILGFDMPIPEKAHLRFTLRGGMSLTRLRGSSIRADGDVSQDQTEAWFYPLMAEVKVRPHYRFPIYPYATFGFDYTFWWINELDSLAEAGGTFGFHGSLGIQISLNWIDKSASRGMKKQFDIRDTMLYAHWRFEKMDDFGKKASWDLSDSRFEFGILFEF